MAATVRRQLGTLPLQPVYYPDTGASVTVKQASNEYHRILGYTYHDYNAPTFARDMCIHVGFGTEEEEDVQVLNSPLAPCQLHAEQIGNEGDVRRFYYRYLSGIPMLALRSLGVIERSETGPTGNVQTSNTVDSRFTLREEVLAIVEHKRPHLISESQWADNENNGLATRNKLSRELRM